VLNWETKNYLALTHRIYVGGTLAPHGEHELSNNYVFHRGDSHMSPQEKAQISFKRIIEEGLKSGHPEIINLYEHLVGLFFQNKPVYIDGQPYRSMYDLP